MRTEHADLSSADLIRRIRVRRRFDRIDEYRAGPVWIPATIGTVAIPAVSTDHQIRTILANQLAARRRQIAPRAAFPSRGAPVGPRVRA